jgi:uncharacterized protein involved in response to NO
MAVKLTDIGTRQHAAAPAGVPLLNLGFRPFFLGATLFAVATMVAWTLIYTYSIPFATGAVSILQWHAHEMVYGYGLAVIAGFLLTAVNNWTGIRTVHGLPLLGLFLLWAAARVAIFVGGALIHAAAVFDLLFAAALVTAIAVPLVRTRMWKQFGILSILVLISAGNLAFYLGYLGYLGSGIQWGVYGGLYLVIGLILVMGRRVIPSFIERGVGYPVTLFNSKWIDVSIPVLFVLLFITQVFLNNDIRTPYLAAALFVLNAVRVAGWYTPGIWKTPLLWGLHLGYACITLGFLLLALSGFAGISGFLAVHSFAYGGIGMVTLSMMVRVSLGHTGRNIHAPPRTVTYALAALGAGTVFRILLPLAFPSQYLAWILVSQVAWIASFALLAGLLFPVLSAPRVDGRPV